MAPRTSSPPPQLPLGIIPAMAGTMTTSQAQTSPGPTMPAMSLRSSPAASTTPCSRTARVQATWALSPRPPSSSISSPPPARSIHRPMAPSSTASPLLSVPRRTISPASVRSISSSLQAPAAPKPGGTAPPGAARPGFLPPISIRPPGPLPLPLSLPVTILPQSPGH